MRLGVDTHFEQGWSVSTFLPYAADFGAQTIRDNISWDRVETTRGVYDFSSYNTSYVRDVSDAGFSLTIDFIAVNPLYNSGDTVVSQADIDAYADFIVATLDEFDNIEQIEIGNEFNGSFVWGPAAGGSFQDRANYYTNILKTVYTEVKASHPDVTVIGGALHSIPVGYVEYLRGGPDNAFDYMDGLSFHPYRSAPEHVDDQIAYLKSVLGTDAVPLYATEVGQEYSDADLGDASAFMLKMVSLLGSAGIEELDWYALVDEPINGDIEWYPNMGLLDNNPVDGTYTQQVTLQFAYSAGAGDVEVNGQIFPVSNDIANITLTGLTADGDDVNLAITFTTSFPQTSSI